jgi:antitoxin PrlF
MQNISENTTGDCSMAKPIKKSSYSSDVATCRLEALVAVDERGQMVLPKEVRERAGILPGEKLALIMWGCEGEHNCLALVKVKDLTGMIRGVLGPLAEDILQIKESNLLSDDGNKKTVRAR